MLHRWPRKGAADLRSITQGRADHVELKAAKLSGQQRAGGGDGCLNFWERQRRAMRLGAGPQFNDEYRVGLFVIDAHFVEQTPDLAQDIAALGQVGDKLVTPSGRAPRGLTVAKVICRV